MFKYTNVRYKYNVFFKLKNLEPINYCFYLFFKDLFNPFLLSPLILRNFPIKLAIHVCESETRLPHKLFQRLNKFYFNFLIKTNNWLNYPIRHIIKSPTTFAAILKEYLVSKIPPIIGPLFK